MDSADEAEHNSEEEKEYDTDEEEIVLQYEDFSEDDTSSCDESDVPLQERWDNFKKNFAWRNDSFNPIVHEFVDPNAGVQDNTGLYADSSVLQIFEFFYCSDVMEMICAMTNLHHDECLEARKQSNKLKKRSRISCWSDVKTEELYIFYALSILMGILKKPKIRMYWSKDPLLKTPAFNSHMSRDRYLNISRYLHYSENLSNDKLRKIRDLFETFNEKYKAAFRPGSKVSVDESLLKFKGRLAFRQCNLSKRGRFGIKLYKCCDAKSGYVYNASIYIGHEVENESKLIGVSGKVVKKMMGDLSKQGRTIFLDNWYSSPSLFSVLHKEKNNVIGTVRLNRKYMPQTDKKYLKKIPKGQVKTFCSDTMIAMLWRDKKIVSKLSTCQTAELVDTGKLNRKTGEAVTKPKCVIEYNDNMGGVDKCDQVIAPYQIPRKTLRWYQKIAANVLDTVIFNSHIIYDHLHGKKTPHLDFRIMLIREIISKYGKKDEKSDDEPDNRHRLCKIQSHDDKRKRLRCHLCRERGKRTDTTWCCAGCDDVPICKDCYRNHEK